jgi:hypothetical protein
MPLLTAKVIQALKAELESRDGGAQVAAAARQFADGQPDAAVLLMGAGLMLGEARHAPTRALEPAAYLDLVLRAAGEPPGTVSRAQLQAASRAVCGPLLDALENPAHLEMAEALREAFPPPGVRDRESEAFLAIVGQSMALASEFNVPGPEALLLMAVHATVTYALLAAAGLVDPPWGDESSLPDAGLGDLADGIGADWPWDDPEATMQSLEGLGLHGLGGQGPGGEA